MKKDAEYKLAFEHGKISYLGEQLKPIPTVLFSLDLPPGETLELFASFDLRHQLYPNDPLPYTRHFLVNEEEIARMRKTTSTLITKGTLAASEQARPGFLSFSVAAPKGEGWEIVEYSIEHGPHRKFYENLIEQLDPANTFGLAALQFQFNNLPP